jgi:D-glycero-beta-D-manno-heptose-7-phosphate kinase
VNIGLSRARDLVAAFPRQRILVVGDLMLDRYVAGTVERISPEAPIPVVRVTRETSVPGGASNVAMNLRSLGGRAVVAGVVGRDAAGRHLAHVLRQAAVGTRGVFALPNARTTVKTRIVAERQQVVRVDDEQALEFGPAALRRFCARVGALVGQATAVIIDDYSKGVVRQEVVDAVLRAARRRRIPVGFDPKRNHGLRLSGVTVVTPNCKEAYEAAGIPERPVGPDPERDAGLRRVGAALLRKWTPRQLIVTLGSHGMLLMSRGRRPRVIPTKAREVFDVSGAGDTVIAACMLAVAAGAEFHEAAAIGNHAAGVVVGKLGTATCSRDELLASIARDERLGE